MRLQEVKSEPAISAALASQDVFGQVKVIPDSEDTNEVSCEQTRPLLLLRVGRVPLRKLARVGKMDPPVRGEVKESQVARLAGVMLILSAIRVRFRMANTTFILRGTVRLPLFLLRHS